MKRTGAPLLVLLLACCGQALAIDVPIESDRWTDRYDDYFKKYTKRYFGPFFDWKWFKAQAIAESGLSHTVTSDAGAVGLMQILPTTYKEIKDDNPHFKDIESPRWNIAAGIYYDRLLYRKWRSPSDHERIYFTLASYNAGYRRILSVYARAAETEREWERFRQRVPGETRYYVKRIRNLMEDERRAKGQRFRGRERFLSLKSD